MFCVYKLVATRDSAPDYANFTWRPQPAQVDSTWRRQINPFKPEFTIVIFIHYKPRIAVAILDL